MREAVRDRRFWIIWLTFFFNGIVIIVISTFYKVIKGRRISFIILFLISTEFRSDIYQKRSLLLYGGSNCSHFQCWRTHDMGKALGHIFLSSRILIYFEIIFDHWVGKMKKMMTCLTILMAIVMGSFYACSTIPALSGKQAMYFIWVCLLFFCLSGSFAMFPTVTSQTFGSTNMAIIYGLIFYGYVSFYVFESFILVFMPCH